MSLRKKDIMIRAVLSTCLFLIFSVGMSFSLLADPVTATETADSKTDRLFREMGIIRIPHIGSPVDFSLSDVNSKQFTLSDFKGKIVFLNFWTTWCPSCRVEMPHMEKLNRRFKNKDFAMIAVNLQESPLRVKKFIDDHRLTFTVLLDKKGEVGPRFGVRAIPVTYILDRDGSIIGKAFGSRRWASEKSMDLFEHLINDKSVHKE